MSASHMQGPYGSDFKYCEMVDGGQVRQGPRIDM